MIENHCSDGGSVYYVNSLQYDPYLFYNLKNKHLKNDV